MQEAIFEARLRTKIGKNVNRRLRAAGEVPAVVYGKDHSPVVLAMNPKPLQRALQQGQSRNRIMTLNLSKDGKKSETLNVLLKDVQRNALTDAWIHVDFLAVNMNEATEVSVPVKLVGKAKGIIEGGIVDVIRREILISCLPTQIPNEITVDISGLDVGDAIHISDISVPEGVKVLDGSHLTLVTCSLPEAEETKEEETEEALEAGAEKPAAEGTAEPKAAEKKA